MLSLHFTRKGIVLVRLRGPATKSVRVSWGMVETTGIVVMAYPTMFAGYYGAAFINHLFGG